MSLASRDQILLQRCHDGELPAADAAALRTRLAAEPALRAGLAALAALRSGFTAGGALAFAAPAGFTGSVLAEVRQLPNRLALQEAAVAAAAVALCRRLLFAAAILFGLGLCWHTGVFDGDRAATLQAQPGELERAMERLDDLARTLPAPERPR